MGKQKCLFENISPEQTVFENRAVAAGVKFCRYDAWCDELSAILWAKVICYEKDRYLSYVPFVTR